MADDLAELSRKMKLIRKQDERLLDIDDITAVKAQAESDDKELIKCEGGIFSRADFDVVTKIMATSMAPLAHSLCSDQQIIQTYPELYRAKPLIKSIMDSE